MLLDFTNPVLDPRITFSRGTNATLVDSTGKITYAPNNLLLRSTMDGAAVGTPGTAPTGWNIALVGIAAGISAVSLDASGNTQIQFSSTAERVYLANSTGVAVAANSTYDFCVTVVATDGVAQIFQIMSVTSPPAGSVETYYADGVLVASTYVPIAGQRLTRRLVTAATTGTISLRIGLGVTGNASGVVTLSKPQLEQVTYQTTPGTYNPTTASAYYGPRFDYDPVTLAPRGLLIEEARTNLLLYSQQFDDVYWSFAGGTTVSANQTAAPDGTTTADLLSETATTSAHFITTLNTVVSYVSGQTYTHSLYVKKGPGATAPNIVQITLNSGAFGTSQYANINISTGVVTFSTGGTASVVNAGSGWYRISWTATAVATTTQQGTTLVLCENNPTASRAPSYAGATTSNVYIYGAQLEAGAFATSYIPTVASTVTRNADNAFMMGANFSSWYNQAEGTFITDADTAGISSAGGGRIITAADSATETNAVASTVSQALLAGIFVASGGATQVNTTSATAVSINTPFKLASAYKLNDCAASFNGATPQTDVVATIPSNIDRMNIGNRGVADRPINGHIRAIAYYNTRLPNTQLQTLTAPSLASPLALDFLSTSYTVGY
jgi:hypothetical protein